MSSSERYTVHEANAPATLWYIRDEESGRPITTWTFDQPARREVWLFTTRADANERARTLNRLAEEVR